VRFSWDFNNKGSLSIGNLVLNVRTIPSPTRKDRKFVPDAQLRDLLQIQAIQLPKHRLTIVTHLKQSSPLILGSYKNNQEQSGTIKGNQVQSRTIKCNQVLLLPNLTSFFSPFQCDRSRSCGHCSCLRNGRSNRRSLWIPQIQSFPSQT